LSRSWTTRARRAGEAEDAYVFTDPATFRAHVEAGGFLEWAEFLGNLYGTPVPAPPPGRDVLLEIDLQGAEQVRERVRDARLVLLVPPSDDVQADRLRGRGDPDERVRERVAVGRHEVARGREIADAVVVNDDLGRAVDEVARIIGGWRSPSEAR
jgi:guanylate kinase